MLRTLLAAAAVMTLSGCAHLQRQEAPIDAFFRNLKGLCGQKYEGRVVSTDASDEAFRNARLVMHVRDCSRDEVRIPFSVGEDRSRTWVLTRFDDGNVRLKHDHRHADGTPDDVTMYGGDSLGTATVERVEFPVDEESIAMFQANGLTASTTNVWAIELHKGRMFAYELRRANRHFRVEFDLTRPVRD
jgi:hypothetical protein